jgi:RNA polymerase sigma-70 factor (ECF subfamily)
MPTDRQLDEKISGWLVADAPRQLSDRVLRETFDRTRGTRQDGRWRALLGSMHVTRIEPALAAVAAVVVMHYYSGFSAAEIARVLGIPEGTARSRLHYATAAMRAALEADARQPVVAHNRTA